MGRLGDVTSPLPVPSNKSTILYLKESFDHSTTSTYFDTERSFSPAAKKRRPDEKAFRARQQRSLEEESFAAQSTAEPPKVAANADDEQYFFRTRTQRDSGARPSSFGSTSPISPLSTLAQRDPRKRERQRLARSDGSLLNVQTRPRVITSAPNLTPTTREALTKHSPEARPPATSQSSRSSCSSLSAASLKAQIFSKIPVLRIPPNATKDGRPPREAKDNYTWKREKSGHWLEIRVGRKRRYDDRRAISARLTPRTHSTSSPLPLDHDELRSGRETLSVQSSPSVDTNFSKSVTTASREGLYCRTKRRLGLKNDPVSSAYIEPLSKTHTSEILQEAADVLREAVERRRLTEETSSITGNRSGLSRLLPSYRRTPHSASSSIRNLMMGKAPETSPDPEVMYSGPDANTYFRTEIGGPDGFTFLPSEARRIGTPPSSHAKRGFFFNYGNPSERRISSPESGPGSSPAVTPGGTIRKRKNSGIDWYKLKEAADEAKDARVVFELNLPEHLPNSPLCPRNPMHKSRGRGLCAYHGRNRLSSSSIEIEDDC